MAILGLAALTGGYVAARMARFAGWKQGLAVWLMSALVALAAAVTAWIAGGELDPTESISMPSNPVDERPLSNGPVLLVLSAAVALALSLAGGVPGERLHRALDREELAAEDKREPETETERGADAAPERASEARTEAEPAGERGTTTERTGAGTPPERYIRGTVSSALLIIDFQNDFTPGGALAVEGGDEIAEPIKRIAPRFDHVFATRDWHPPDHASFETQGGPWPVHCVQGTHGAELHPAMRDVPVEAVVDVGAEREDEGYSGFEKSKLEYLLRELDVDRVAVVGLATDYCVRASTIDACELGFDTTVITDAIRAVDVNPGDGERAIEEMKEAGAKLATSDQVLAAQP